MLHWNKISEKILVKKDQFILLTDRDNEVRYARFDGLKSVYNQKQECTSIDNFIYWSAMEEHLENIDCTLPDNNSNILAVSGDFIVSAGIYSDNKLIALNNSDRILYNVKGKIKLWCYLNLPIID